MTEEEKMDAMRAWLGQVAQALDIETETIDACTPVLLDLVRDVARGPSRPGGPITAFSLGLALGRRHPEASRTDAALLTAELAASLDPALEPYRASQSA